MNLVMSVCDYIYVMDFGTKIYEGDPESVQNSEVVRAAYLGGATPVGAAAEPATEAETS
jgi:ABC-type branched-subunit amino acid transport system ATPase component